MNICLINPESTLKKNKSNLALDNLEVGYMAAVLNDYVDRIDIFDMDVSLIDFDTIINVVLHNKYTIIGIFLYHYNHYNAVRLINKLKKKSNDFHIVVGGYYPTLHYEELLENIDGIDYCIVGEPEFIMKDLIHSLDNNIPLNKIKGLAYIKNKEVIFNGRRGAIKDIDVLPFPIRVENKNYAPMIVSRGCYENCIFCVMRKFSSTFQGFLRKRSVTNVIDEMEYLSKFGVRKVYFVDNNLLFCQGGRYEHWVKIFCEELKKRELDISYCSYARPKDIILQKEYLPSLKSTGLEKLNVEVQNFDPKTIRYYKKDTTLSENVEALQLLAENNILYSVLMIIFHPTVTIKEILNNLLIFKEIQFYEKAHITQTPLTCFPPLFPLRDTYFYDLLLKSPHQYSYYINGDYFFCYNGVNDLYKIIIKWKAIIMNVEQTFFENKKNTCISNGENLLNIKSKVLKLDLLFFINACELMLKGECPVQLQKRLINKWNDKLQEIINEK